jgi:hypothetical protein
MCVILKLWTVKLSFKQSWEIVAGSGVPRNFVRGGGGGGCQEIKLWTEGRENGDLGAVNPWSGQQQQQIMCSTVTGERCCGTLERLWHAIHSKRPRVLRQGVFILHNKGGPHTPNRTCDWFRRCGRVIVDRLPDLAPTDLDLLWSS